MEPKKKALEKLKESGDDIKINKCISAGFLLMNAAKNYIDIADETSRKYGIVIGFSKMNFNKTMHHYELYKNEIQRLIGDPAKIEHLFEDFEQLTTIINKFIGDVENENS